MLVTELVTCLILISLFIVCSDTEIFLSSLSVRYLVIYKIIFYAIARCRDKVFYQIVNVNFSCELRRSDSTHIINAYLFNEDSIARNAKRNFSSLQLGKKYWYL